MESVSVVVPVYKSEGSLAALVARVQSVLDSSSPSYELILVNDGSRDGSWQKIVELVEQHAWIRAIDLRRNYGQHNALLCGIRAATYDIIATIDDDLQNPPEEIPRLVGKLQEGFDVVYGTPEREQHGLWRDLASWITKFTLQSAMRTKLARNVSAFRVFRTNIRDAFTNYQSPFLSIDVLLTWGTARFGWLPVRHDPRRVGTSNYTFSRLVVHAINMLTGFSTLPLQVASILGFGCTFFGLLVLAFVIVRYAVEGGSVAGFPFLASVVAIFSGAQLFSLGIFGEYLARIHHRTMAMPPYSIRSVIEGTTMPNVRVSMSDRGDAPRASQTSLNVE